MSKDTRAKVPIARCPDCRERIRIGGRLYVGKNVSCSNCEAELVVVETDPVELDWAYDDDYDEDEEEW